MRRTIFEAEHETFRESVRAFLTKEALPHTDRWESEGMVDRSFWRAAAELGFVGFAAPEEHGGAGLRDFRFNAVIDEEVVRTGTVGDNFSLTNDIVLPYFIDLATPDQQARWLPDIVSGERVCAIAMSEPGTGSDLRAIATTATWDGDAYRLNGSKTFVTNGVQAEIVIVAAKLKREGYEGLGLFVVEEGLAGFERGRKLDKIGRRAQDTGELFFDDTPVTDDDVLGELGRGLNHLMGNLAQERLSMAVTATASAERAMEIAVEYAQDRKAFGKPIGSFQANRFRLAELSTKTAVTRAYIDRCIEAQVAGELSDAEAAGAKFWATELEFEALDACLQIHGGYGYMEEYEVARRWRDARVQQIYGGTNEIMREIVGRSLGL
jgi:alkylation response protein AidB-like acyl-CoA dehydrogenase